MSDATQSTGRRRGILLILVAVALTILSLSYTNHRSYLAELDRELIVGARFADVVEALGEPGSEFEAEETRTVEAYYESSFLGLFPAGRKATIEDGVIISVSSTE